LPLKLREVILDATQSLALASKIEVFFIERIDFYLREVRAHAYDVAKAVMAAGTDDLRDLIARAEAVTAMRGSDDFLAVSAAFKRMKNILAQAEFVPTGASIPGGAGLAGSPEMALRTRYIQVNQEVQLFKKQAQYREALERMASMRPEIDRFFESVMVLDPDPSTRLRRLDLLATTVGTFTSIADFSEIVTAG
jgi:glycyl-tRNA synthetase beta chain